MEEPPVILPPKAPNAVNSDKETNEPLSLYLKSFNGLLSNKAMIFFAQRLAIWCAAWAFGGTGLPSSCIKKQQSPMAKIVSSFVVCKVFFTTNWLIRLISNPSKRFVMPEVRMPADHTIKSAGICCPSFVTNCFFSASTIIVLVLTSTPNLRSSSVASLEMRSGNAGKIREPASTKVTFKRLLSICP